MDQQLSVEYEGGLWKPPAGIEVKQHTIDRFKKRFYEQAVMNGGIYSSEIEDEIKRLFRESVQVELRSSGSPRRWHPVLEALFYYRIDRNGNAVIETVTRNTASDSNKDELPTCPACGNLTEARDDPCPHCEIQPRRYKT